MRDFVGEKSYRDKVNEFLHDGQVKLFRSMQEGNFLVRLMDISFTPNQQLGRLIGSFQATAYQIADLTIENYFKYNILDNIIYNESQNIINNEIVFGQEDNCKDLNVIKEKYNRKYFFNNYGYETVFNNFNQVKITAITEWPINEDNDIRLSPGQSIILKGNDINSFTIPAESIIEYEANIKITYIQDAFKTQYVSTNIGQLKDYQENIIVKLQELYNQNIENLYLQEIESIDAIEFKNQNNTDCIVEIVYADKDSEGKNITTNITIGANNDYTLLSDELKRKEIISIVPKEPINVNYYYTLSKKYYL
jgi:hypothetical protein